MSQWGTQTCATETPDGMVWPDIVSVFYSNVSWSYLHNFLLNPNAENNQLYPWGVLDGTFERHKSTSGAYYWKATPTSSAVEATFRQDRPWEGTSGQTFHAVAFLALRAGVELLEDLFEAFRLVLGFLQVLLDRLLHQLQGRVRHGFDSRGRTENFQQVLVVQPVGHAIGADQEQIALALEVRVERTARVARLGADLFDR